MRHSAFSIRSPFNSQALTVSSTRPNLLTLTATITVNGKTYGNSAPLVLTLAANPYVIDADAGNQYTTLAQHRLANLHR